MGAAGKKSLFPKQGKTAPKRGDPFRKRAGGKGEETAPERVRLFGIIANHAKPQRATLLERVTHREKEFKWIGGIF